MLTFSTVGEATERNFCRRCHGGGGEAVVGYGSGEDVLWEDGRRSSDGLKSVGPSCIIYIHVYTKHLGHPITTRTARSIGTAKKKKKKLLAGPTAGGLVPRRGRGGAERGGRRGKTTVEVKRQGVAVVGR